MKASVPNIQTATDSRWLDRSRQIAQSFPRLAIVATLGIGVAFAIAQMFGLTPLAFDAAAYWAATPGSLYKTGWEGREYAAFLYSPAFADALAPLRLLPVQVFTGLWQLGLFVTLAVVLRVWSLPLVAAGLLWFAVPIPLLGVVMADIAHGNLQILLGAVAVLGLRYPALWSFALLSKVTPGIGLLWFVARGEWRHLAVALAATGAITLASFVYIPGDWFAWAAFLQESTSTVFPQWVVPVPLGIRLATGAALIVWGARTDRPWVLPIACGWVIPMPYLSMLATMAFALYYVPRRGHGLQPRASH